MHLGFLDTVRVGVHGLMRAVASAVLSANFASALAVTCALFASFRHTSLAFPEESSHFSSATAYAASAFAIRTSYRCLAEGLRFASSSPLVTCSRPVASAMQIFLALPVIVVQAVTSLLYLIEMSACAALYSVFDMAPAMTLVLVARQNAAASAVRLNFFIVVLYAALKV